jgi:hypothetical protein
VYEEAFETVVKETLIEVVEPDVAVPVGAEGVESWVAVGTVKVATVESIEAVVPFLELVTVTV